MSRSIPNRPSWAAAIPETGPIEGNDAVALSRKTEHSAQFEILAGHAIAVKQYYGATLAPFEVMESHTLDAHKPAGGRVPALRLVRPVDVPGGHRRGRTGKGDTRS